MKPKVIVITGASSGIGWETAKLLAKAGHQLVLGARRSEKLEQLVKEIKANHGEAISVTTDVGKNEDVENLAQTALKTFHRIDVWINNAGIMPQSYLKFRAIKDWDETIDTNIKGVLYGIAATLPVMEKQKTGHIINISSVAGHFAHAGGAVYSATKWAVRAISESLREEMAVDQTNIRVTIVSPGAINTELLGSVHDQKLRADFKDFYQLYGIEADRVALTIKQAIDLPDDASWNEIIIRPTKQII